MNKLSIRDLDMAGKRVFIRVDFNVPLDGGKVADDTRIRETLPTLRLAVERGARLVLASHLGRPKGKVNPKYSLAPVAARLKELLGKPVEFAGDCVGAEAEAKSKALATAACYCSKTCAFIPKKKPMTRAFRNNWPRCAISFSFATLSARRIAPMLRLWASRSSCASPPRVC